MATKLETIEQQPRTSFIRDGVAGNFDIVFQMVRITRNAVYNKSFQDFVNRFFISQKIDGNSSAESKLRAIYNFVIQNTTYLKDVAGRIESIKSPQRTLSDGYGDCDDLSILLAAMCGVAGFESVRFVLAAYRKDSTKFSHIYVDVSESGKRYVLDAALPNPQFNYEIPATNQTAIKIFGVDETADSVYGVLKQTLYSLKDAYRGTIDGFQFFSGMLPLPAFAGVNIGLNLVHSATTKNHSLNEIGADVNAELDRLILQLQRNEIAFDVAKLTALQIASRLNVTNWGDDLQSYRIVKQSVKRKLDWIANYTENAETKIQLNQKGMIFLGVGIAGVLAYYYFFKKGF